MNDLMHAICISVAAADSNAEAKAAADLLCTGAHDELVVQEAINRASAAGKDVFLFDGMYAFDGFYDQGDGGPMTALCFPKSNTRMHFQGQHMSFSTVEDWKSGVIFYVTPTALAGIGDTPVDVLRSAWVDPPIFNLTALYMENITVMLYDNQHPVRCFDWRATWNVSAKDLRVNASGHRRLAPDTFEPTVAVPGCIGFTLTDGSNNAGNNFINLIALEMYEGIQVGGEHPVLINCAVASSVYGFTFGNYPFHCGQNHPITLINCCDEQNIHMPFFNTCGDNGGKTPGGQAVDFISYNLERVEDQIPGGKRGDCMREAVPGQWHGHLEITLQPRWWDTNKADEPLWAFDGSGIGFDTRNSTHKKICSSAERRTYAPCYGQTVFDTDLNKLLICINPEHKTWVDANGNVAE